LLIAEGQTVETGQIIAKNGASLHFEMLRDRQYLNPIFFAMTE
jgi:murein DD-endopeptidase MepM/ murein hydrolase activator NlpD